MLCRNLPVDAERIVKNGYATVCFRMVEVVAFILENGGFAKYGEAMCKATRYEELSVIVLCEFHSNMFAVCGRSFADVHSHVKYGAFYATHKLALRIRWTLEMQSSHDTIG